MYVTPDDIAASETQVWPFPHPWYQDTNLQPSPISTHGVELVRSVCTVPSLDADVLFSIYTISNNKDLLPIITQFYNVFYNFCTWSKTVQKRGLTHAHILIWLKEKIRPGDVDSVIRAEIPDVQQDPIQFEIVSKHMIHGPCGALKMKSLCMKDKKCIKRYPRKMICETQTAEDDYPLYRRRKLEQGSHTTVINLRIDNKYHEVQIDNRWVVPYSPILSNIFQAHINVEYCNSVKSIKYICKYINKGSDTAVVEINNATTGLNDEIARYQMGRYINSNEAVWRILRFPIHDRYPTVVHLSAHLENGQRVYFASDNAHNTQPPVTTLTAYFKLCQEDTFAKTLLYIEIPKYYTWNKYKNNLVGGNKPSSLCQKYKERLREDILHQKQRENPDLHYVPQIYNETLTLLEDKCLSICGKTLLQLGLPVPTRQAHHTLDRDLLREANYYINILQHMVETNKPLLTEDQRTAYEAVRNLIAEGKGGILFLDTSGGTGKTIIINLILAEIRSKRHIALAVASSGTPSTLLVGGLTAHSALQLPLKLAQPENPICNISKSSGKATVLRTRKLIVWNEYTMSNKKGF
ncbi:hypothetical protein AVEN_257377-1 [Araneus ventricosus]|uniref:ATP-dependent DNA helicase n=1 Tax=Araneus ventricosus TaxID=182803 RepID=A0A4Y2C8V7_ARAVE|nr:hypothetical protein AVEN_257377-1 [Araneus ventricosus]